MLCVTGGVDSSGPSTEDDDGDSSQIDNDGYHSSDGGDSSGPSAEDPGYVQGNDKGKGIYTLIKIEIKPVVVLIPFCFIEFKKTNHYPLETRYFIYIGAKVVAFTFNITLKNIGYW